MRSSSEAGSASTKACSAPACPANPPKARVHSPSPTVKPTEADGGLPPGARVSASTKGSFWVGCECRTKSCGGPLPALTQQRDTIAGTARNDIVAGAAHQHIRASAADNRVVAVAAIEHEMNLAHTDCSTRNNMRSEGAWS